MRIKNKYKIVGTQKNATILYHLVQINNKTGKPAEKWVAINLLRRLYYQGQIVGTMNDYLKSKLNGQRRKRRNGVYSVFNEEGIFEIKS